MAVDTSGTNTFTDLQVGDRVKHSKFGEGQIMQRSGFGDETKLVVTFAEEGEKRLLAKYAGLKRIQPIETEKKAKAKAQPEPKEKEKEEEAGEDFEGEDSEEEEDLGEEIEDEDLELDEEEIEEDDEDEK
ncbi:hypothetical protein HQ520_06340 [bacterium]|nr:hypothetical protein [bacterium]